MKRFNFQSHGNIFNHVKFINLFRLVNLKPEGNQFVSMIGSDIKLYEDIQREQIAKIVDGRNFYFYFALFEQVLKLQAQTAIKLLPFQINIMLISINQIFIMEWIVLNRLPQMWELQTKLLALNYLVKGQGHFL
jgi:hypothetical protein